MGDISWSGVTTPATRSSCSQRLVGDGLVRSGSVVVPTGSARAQYNGANVTPSHRTAVDTGHELRRSLCGNALFPLGWFESVASMIWNALQFPTGSISKIRPYTAPLGNGIGCGHRKYETNEFFHNSTMNHDLKRD